MSEILCYGKHPLRKCFSVAGQTEYSRYASQVADTGWLPYSNHSLDGTNATGSITRIAVTPQPCLYSHPISSLHLEATQDYKQLHLLCIILSALPSVGFVMNNGVYNLDEDTISAYESVAGQTEYSRYASQVADTGWLP